MVHLPSALCFDIGVFSVVAGSTLLVLLALAHQSIRAQRAHEQVLEEARKAGAAVGDATGGGLGRMTGDGLAAARATPVSAQGIG